MKEIPIDSQISWKRFQDPLEALRVIKMLMFLEKHSLTDYLRVGAYIQGTYDYTASHVDLLKTQNPKKKCKVMKFVPKKSANNPRVRESLPAPDR